MYGEDIGELNILVETSRGNTKLLWKRRGNQGNRWLRGYVKINYDNYRIIIEGISTAGIRDNIAVDDVHVADCNMLSMQKILYLFIFILI